MEKVIATATRDTAVPLERDAELATLSAAVDAVATGAGRIVHVHAAAGLGKSRLLEEAASMASERGLVVLRATGGELERELPFGVALQLFEARLRSAGDEERARLTEGSARLATPLFEPDAARAPARESPDLPIVHGLYWLTSNLAEEQPLALLIDDAHWADTQSLVFLNYLAQRAPDLPLLLVVASRPREPGAAAGLLDRLSAVDQVTPLSPRALSDTAVAELLAPWAGDDAEPEVVRAAAEVTGGNPLLVRELVHAMTEEGSEATPDAVPRIRELGPAPVSRAVFLGLRRLDPGATDLARAVAVLGDDAELVHAAALAGLPIDDAARAAGELESAGIFRRSEGLGFLHPIMRNALYSELGPTERALGHRKAARVIAGAAPIDRVAAHLLASSPAGDPWVVEQLRRAATRASAHGAPETAAAQLRRALEEPPAPDQRAELLADLGRAEAAAGRHTALESLSEALEALGDTQRAAEIQHDIGRLLYAQGRFAESAAAFERGLEQFSGSDDDPLRNELQAGYVAAALWDPAIGAEAAARVAPLISTARGPASRGERALLATLAGAEVMRGEDHSRAYELGHRAWDDGAFLERADVDHPSLPAITGGLTSAGAFAETQAVTTAAIAEARERGSVFEFATASYLRASATIFMGLLDETIADLEIAIETRRFGWEAQLPSAVGYLGAALIERGDLDAAERALATLDFDPAAAPSPLYAPILRARGHLMLARGDAAAALENFARAGELRDRMLGTTNPAVMFSGADKALALARLRRHEEAERAADEDLRSARRYGAAWAIGIALKCRGMVAQTDGLSWLAEAVEVLEQTEARLELAHALGQLGAALRRAGKRSEAREPLRRALDLADQCRAAPLAAWCGEELTAAGARPRRARQSGPAALTPSEARVARMAADGHTNRQIADALFVTPKAVSFHLGNVYRKLEISSRDELPQALAD